MLSKLGPSNNNHHNEILDKRFNGESSSSNQVNILFVHANNADIGGADYCMFKLAYELNDGFFHPIVLLGRRTEIVHFYELHNISVIITPIIRIQKRFNLWYYFKLMVNFLPTIYRIRNIIRKHRIHVVFSNDLLDFYGGIAARIAGVKSVQYIRMILPGNSIFKKIIARLVLTINDRVWVVSEAVGRYMFHEKKKSSLHKKVEVLNDWIDLELVGHTKKYKDIRKEFQLNGKKVVTSISRLEPWKGQKVLLKAIPKVISKFPNTIFLVVGGKVLGRNREYYEDELKALAKELRVEDHLIFMGERKDIKAILEASDIFVHSPISPDPFPGVVLEAMSCAKPVVGSDDGGIPEQVDSGKTGLLFHTGDSDELANRLIELLEQPQKIITMGEKGYERVYKLFSKKAISPQVKRSLGSLIKSEVFQ